MKCKSHVNLSGVIHYFIYRRLINPYLFEAIAESITNARAIFDDIELAPYIRKDEEICPNTCKLEIN